MSTVAGADQVVVLDRGRIVEHGTHNELMRIPGGLYRSFRTLDGDAAGGFTPDEQVFDGATISPELVLVAPELRQARVR
jgi:ABC-type microcin C transport system duplicated ATPase subunit YejF